MIRALAIPDATAAASTAPVNLAVTMLVIFGSAKLLAELFERMKQPGSPERFSPASSSAPVFLVGFLQASSRSQWRNSE